MVKLKLSLKSFNYGGFFFGLILIGLAWYEFCGWEAEKNQIFMLNKTKQSPFELNSISVYM